MSPVYLSIADDYLFYDDEGLVMRGSQLYRLSSVAMLIFRLCTDHPRHMDELVEQACAEFGEPPESTATELTAKIMDELIGIGIITSMNPASHE